MRKINRSQLVHDLSAAYPEVVRLALLLTGREDIARGVGTFVLRKAVPAWRTWTDEAQQQNWFFHHTLLTTRRAEHHRAWSADDVLLRGAGNDIEYLSFIRALRDLPFQQSEAFLLFDILGFDLRRSAVTMDLSTTATANHLEAARRTLKGLVSTRYDAMIARLRATAASISSDEFVSIPRVERAVSLYLWPRRIKRLLYLLLLLGAAYLAFRFSDTIVDLIHSLRAALGF